MHAMIRHYRIGTGSIDELLRHVDATFAAQLDAALSDGTGETTPVRIPPGIVGYQALKTGEDTLVTITLFETAEQVQQAQGAAAQIRQSLAAWQVEETQTVMGEVMVSRGSKSLVDPIHPTT